MRYYGAWSGNPQGTPEDRKRCIVQVWPTGRFIVAHQCQKGRGCGPDGMFCRQHANLFAVGTISQRDIPEDKPCPTK